MIVGSCFAKNSRYSTHPCGKEKLSHHHAKFDKSDLLQFYSGIINFSVRFLFFYKLAYATTNYLHNSFPLPTNNVHQQVKKVRVKEKEKELHTLAAKSRNKDEGDDDSSEH